MDEYERRQKRVVAWIFVATTAIAIVIGLCGCTTTKYVPVETIRTDSIEHIREVINNVYVKDSTITVQRNDTVWRDRWRIIYRDRHSTDTLWRTREVKVEVPVLVEKKLSWWQQAKLRYSEAMLGAAVALSAIMLWIIRKRSGNR